MGRVSEVAGDTVRIILGERNWRSFDLAGGDTESVSPCRCNRLGAMVLGRRGFEVCTRVWPPIGGSEWLAPEPTLGRRPPDRRPCEPCPSVTLAQRGRACHIVPRPSETCAPGASPNH